MDLAESTDRCVFRRWLAAAPRRSRPPHGALPPSCAAPGRCRTRVEGVSAAESLGTLLTARGGSGWPDSGLAGYADRSRLRRVRSRRGLRREEVRGRHPPPVAPTL